MKYVNGVKVTSRFERLLCRLGFHDYFVQNAYHIHSGEGSGLCGQAKMCKRCDKITTWGAAVVPEEWIAEKENRELEELRVDLRRLFWGFDESERIFGTQPIYVKNLRAKYKETGLWAEVSK